MSSLPSLNPLSSYLTNHRNQKSKEKNLQLEELHRRNEANIRRKAAGPNALSSAALAASDSGDAPKSPANTGAMDDLLKKLRDAKPEARDQRDRRRRARLKDRHQVRVASGQKMPEIGVNMEDGGEGGEEEDAGRALLSPSTDGGDSVGAGVQSPTESSTPAGGDVADRAAAMLEGLTGGSALAKDGSLVVRRRRENADSERERRRRRRQGAAREGEDGLMSPTGEGERRGSAVSLGEKEEGPATPVTIVSPPSPEGGKGAGEGMVTPPPE